MSSLVFLTAVLSLETTRQLVAAGYGLGYDTEAAAADTTAGVGRFTNMVRPSTSAPFPSLSITACTGNGVSPIVITTAYPHGVSSRGIGGMSCIVSGVTGNTAANNLAVDPNNRTVGLPEGVLAVPMTSTALALYGQDQDPASLTVGRIVPLVGNGAWAGGGTVVPALTDGSILMGRENVREHSAPPRIVMVPRAIGGWGMVPAAIPNGNRTAERLAERSQRRTRSKGITFDVHIWGQRQPPDAAYDFDICNVMQDAIVDGAWLLNATQEDPGPGIWDDQGERQTQYIKAGHLLTFSMNFIVPVTDNALPFVPPGSTLQSVIQTTTPEVGATLDLNLS